MKKFNNRPNKQYQSIEDGKVRYDSRSIAVCGIIILCGETIDSGFSVLVHKRGPKCPDERGKISFNCGYLDWDETLKDAIKREIYEEIGLDLDSMPDTAISLIGVDDSIEGENAIKQNITLRFTIIVSKKEILEKIKSGEINNESELRGGEEGEVSEIFILDLPTNTKKEEWAFNHYEVLQDLEKELLNLKES